MISEKNIKSHWLLITSSHKVTLRELNLALHKLDLNKMIFFISDWTEDQKGKQKLMTFQKSSFLSCSDVQTDHAWVVWVKSHIA